MIGSVAGDEQAAAVVAAINRAATRVDAAMAIGGRGWAPTWPTMGDVADFARRQSKTTV